MKNVLIVNQSAELYGADKIILELILNFPAGYTPIVVLHEEGPLKELLRSRDIQVIHSSVIKVKRGILNLRFFLNLPLEALSSFRTINKELKGKEIHLVHSNATSVFIGAFYSFFLRKKHLWHVHEIIEKPKKAAQLYPKIVSFFSDKVVFNSKATAKHFISSQPSIRHKSRLVYNGQERTQPISSDAQISDLRQNQFKAIDSEIVIGLVGRISQIKGQLLLLKAFLELTTTYRNIKLVFIGSAPKGKEFYLEEVKQFIKDHRLEEKTVILDFQENIWPFYDAMDIVTFPSTEKESFGLVATEAMLSHKPVVAADHGGLSEIVAHQETGLLFEPNNAQALALSLASLINSSERRIQYGKNGHKRVTEIFSLQKYVEGIRGVYDDLTA